MGDAKAIYLRKDRKGRLASRSSRLRSRSAIRELSLQLFPEDEEHIVAFLDQTYYKFRKP